VTAPRVESAENETTHKRWLRADTLADSVMILLAVTVVQRLVGFGRGVVFCRWLEPEQVGQWEMAFRFLLLAAPVAVLGLPGSFGRYLEHFRARGQTRMFLRRTTFWIVGLGLCAALTVGCANRWFAELIFGSADAGAMVATLAAALAAVILHHYIESLFAALRMFRIVSGMHFCQSVTFAVVGVALLWATDLGAMAIVVAYGAASLLSAAGSLLWLRAALRELPTAEPFAPPRTFWAKLLPFAAWVWVANLLAQLFAVVDRYMIIHFGGFDADQALAQIGNYHSSLIVPLLLVGVADLLRSLITPHLSHDWEAGRRDAVSARLNLTIKLASVALFIAGFVVLLFSPLLFSVAFEGKFSAGQDVMPWALLYCIWFALALLSQTYLWCAERAWLSSLPLLLGLVANVVLNLLLLPKYGLWGAVLGTTSANGLALGLTLLLNRVAGMRLDRAAIVLCAAPLALGFGLWPSLVVLLAVLLEAVSTDRLFSRDEKLQLFETAMIYVRRAQGVAPPQKVSGTFMQKGS
jgi:O-antigen/teichoic acid export membrane protein